MTRQAPAKWPDEEIVRAAQCGDEIAITLLVETSHPHVQRFARNLCATPQDAEEAVQEALIALFRKIGTLRVAGALVSWLFQVVKHECMRRARLTLRAPVADGAARSTEELAFARLEIERLIRCVAALPDEQREVLILRDLQGLSGAETADALGLERAAMKSRLHRAREAVRTQLRAPEVTLRGA